MNIAPENRTPYEQDMITRVVTMEFSRAEFLSRPSVMLELIPYQDGNMWGVLLGRNLQEGISGFGKTPDEAMLDFDRHWKGEGEK
jgi:hypothetical protein